MTRVLCNDFRMSTFYTQHAPMFHLVSLRLPPSSWSIGCFGVYYLGVPKHAQSLRSHTIICISAYRNYTVGFNSAFPKLLFQKMFHTQIRCTGKREEPIAAPVICSLNCPSNLVKSVPSVLGEGPTFFLSTP